MGDARRRELQILEKALARILQEENPLPSHEQHAREAELSRRLSSDSSHGSPSPAQALDSQDLSIMSRLLSQVHDLLEGENKGEELLPAEDIKRPNIPVHHAETEKNMVQTVVEIASAAAEAAKAAAASSGKNLEVMETLLSNSEKTVRPTRTDENGGAAEAAPEDESSRQLPVDKNIIKRLEMQNRITHWVLGFMVVATAVWRFKMVSMILGVRKTFSNPIQAFGDMVTEGFKGANNKDEANGGGKGFHKARTGFPSFLGGEEKEIRKKTEKTEKSTTEDFKIGEAITLSFDNLLSASGMSDNKQANEDASDDSSGSAKD